MGKSNSPKTEPLFLMVSVPTSRNKLLEEAMRKLKPKNRQEIDGMKNKYDKQPDDISAQIMMLIKK